VKIAILRVGRRGVLLRSRLSDGSEELTVVDSADLGGEIGVGVDGRLAVGGIVLLDAGAGISAGSLARLGHTRTWRVRDHRAGDVLQHRLVEHLAGDVVGTLAPLTRPLQHLLGIGKGRRLPEPDMVSDRGEGSVHAGGHAGAEAVTGDAVGGEAQASAAGAVARRHERATGRTTYVFELSGSAGAAFTGALRGGAAASGATAIAVTYDRRAALLDLTVTTAGADGPDSAARGSGAGRAETARSLDLTSSHAAEAVSALLAALRPDRLADLPAAASALAARLAADSTVEVRRYDTSHDTWVDASAEAALVAKAGLSLSVRHDTERLVDAWTRPPGGLWERRVDCLRV
jgi:hypothetical protein